MKVKKFLKTLRKRTMMIFIYNENGLHSKGMVYELQENAKHDYRIYRIINLKIDEIDFDYDKICINIIVKDPAVKER